MGIEPLRHVSPLHVSASMRIQRGDPRFARLLTFFAVVLVCALVAAWNVYGRPSSGVDDAVIAFVYADHLAEGHGFVYNVGGERVEGFSSLLWVILLSGLFAVTDRVEVALYVFNLLIVSVSVATATWVLGRLTRSRGGPGRGMTYSTVIFAAWLVATPAYVAWSLLSLLEIGLYGAVILLATSVLLFMLLEGDDGESVPRWVFPGLIALLVLLRPESMLVAPVLIGLALLVRAFLEGPRRAWRHAAPPLGAYIATLALLVAFRLWYFGFPLPNTYYAKVSDDLGYNLITGGEYLLRFLYFNPLAAVLLVAAVVGVPFRAHSLWIRGGRRLGPDELRPALAEVVLGVLITLLAVVPVLNGGDHFAQSRFYQPLWPLLAMYALVRIHRELGGRLDEARASRSPWRLGLVATGSLVLFGLLTGVRWDEVARGNPDSFASEFHITEWGLEKGRALASAVRDPANAPTVGVICAGGFKRGYPFPVVDLMGLNDVRMGHSGSDRRGRKNHAAFDRSVFFARVPDVLVVDCGDFGQPCFPAGPEYPQVNAMLKGLLADPGFEELYVPARVRHGNESVALYAHRERLAELRPLGLETLDTSERCPSR